MNYKFTADGKKVVVIGALNAKESIVQEVYCTDGTEFPAGEHFVVKTLLDAPAETYKAKEERGIVERIARLNQERDKISLEISRFRFSAAAAAAKVKWIQGINEPEVERAFEHIKSVLCGEYTHVVFGDYRGLEIREWDAELFSQSEGYGEGRRFDGIRLVSLYGVWNKRLELDWRVSNYCDGSGSSSKSFTLCKSLQDAVNFCAESINAKDHISDNDVEFCAKYGIAIDPAKNAARIRNKSEAKEKEIADTKVRLAKQETELSEMATCK